MDDHGLVGEIAALVVSDEADLQRIALGDALPASASRPWLRVELTAENTPPEATERPWVLLVPADRRSPSGYGLESERVAFHDGGSVVVRGEARKAHAIARGETLSMALPRLPRPVRRAHEELFVQLPDTPAVARAVHALLLLGATNLRLGTAETGEEAGETIHLLRITRPSVYLVERWQDAGYGVYRPLNTRAGAATGTWIELGWRHPWEGLAGVSVASSDEDAHVLIPHEGAAVSIADPALRSAFDLLDLEIDAHPERWRPIDVPPRFEVPLQWGFRAQALDAEIWILSDDEVDRLEQLFGVLTHTELDNLQLACLEDPSTGDDRYVVREALTGRSRQYLEFGAGFAALPGVPGLFVPVDRTIEPPVPRDMLARLFDVAPRRSQIVTDSRIDAHHAARASRRARPSLDDGMRILTVEDAAFQPLLSLVEHRVRGARQVLERIVDRSILDLGPLAELPSRPAPAPAGPPAPAEEEPEPDAAPAPVDTHDAAPEDTQAASPSDEDEERRARRRERLARDIAAAQEARRDDDEAAALREALEDAERHAVAHLEAPDPWVALAEVEVRAGELEDAVASLEHAQWVAEQSAAAAQARTLLEDVLEAVPSGQSQALDVRRRVLGFPHRTDDETSADYMRRMSTVIADLRAHEEALPHKARWLLWRELLARNPDEVEATRVSETILRELSLNGISEADSFGFVRRQIRRQFEQQSLPEGILGLLDRWSALARRIGRPDMRLDVVGAIAVAREAAGGSDAVADVLAERGTLAAIGPEQGAAAHATCAAALARAGHPGAAELFDGAVDRLEAMRAGYRKELVLHDVLEQLRVATLLGDETRLVERILRVIAGHEPHHRCLNLDDNAETLIDLGAATAASEVTRELFEFDAVLNEMLYLSYALSAHVKYRGGRAPDEDVARICVSHLLSLTSFEEYAARCLDIAMRGVDASIIERIQRAAEHMAPDDALMLETCLVRAFATFGQTDEGLAFLAERLEAVWTIDNPTLAATALLRLVPSAAHFGRPDRGIELVDSVVARLGRKEARRLEPRKRGELLAACAAAVGRLGAPDRALSMLERIVDAFDALVDEKDYGVSFLYMNLGVAVDEVIALGETERGLPIVERAIETIDTRLANAYGTDNPYFVHHARLRCAIAFISFDAVERGLDLLTKSARAIEKVRQFQIEDRVDLALEAIRGLSLVELSDSARLETLDLLVETGFGEERESRNADENRRKLLHKTMVQLVQRQSAYRLALTKMRAREERLIRERVLDRSLLGDDSSEE